MAETITHNYIAQVYRQGDAPQELLTFCAPAEQIKQWGGIPAKTTRFHGGFQRALGERFNKIVKFFEAKDVSPTSIIVAFRGGKLNVTPLGYPPGWAEEGSLAHVPQFAHVSFSHEDYDVDEADVYELAKKVAVQMATRLPTSEEEEEPEEETDSEEDSESEPESESEDDDGEDDELGNDQELDIGQSRLRDFYSFVSSEEKISAWLESEDNRREKVQAKKKKSKKDRKFLALTPSQRLKRLLVSLLKPAMIVDGQHRTMGAAEASTQEEVVFSVCALKDADWIEQVFQFVVLNKLAKPISSDFLTGLLNTSLTNAEIEQIDPKLDRIGIKNTDRLIMKTVNFDPKSPFHNMVAQAGEVVGADSSGKLSGRGAISVAKRWRNLASGSKRQKREFKMFEKCFSYKTQKERKRAWQSKPGHWEDVFHAFWHSLKALYEPGQVWEKGPGFNLLMIVTMRAIQDFFIETKSTSDTRFESLSDFKSQVTTFFEDVPASFFQGWEATGLQSGEGPAEIRNALKLFKEGETLKSVREQSVLFKKVKK